MTVKQLIAELKDQHQDSVVVMSRDSEGNGYSPLSSLQEAVYRADSKSRGDLVDDEDIEDDDVPAVVLWPIS